MSRKRKKKPRHRERERSKAAAAPAEFGGDSAETFAYEEPGEDLSETTTAKERLEMMWPMTVAAWTLAGKKIPDYPRDKTPIRVVRRGKPRRGDGM